MNLIRMEGKGGYGKLWIFLLPHLHFTGSPGPATQFMELVRNESLGHKSVGPFVKEILGIDVGEVTPDGKFSIEPTRCVGACGLAPVMTVNGEVYGNVDPSKVKDILDKYE